MKIQVKGTNILAEFPDDMPKEEVEGVLSSNHDLFKEKKTYLSGRPAVEPEGPIPELRSRSPLQQGAEYITDTLREGGGMLPGIAGIPAITVAQGARAVSSPWVRERLLPYLHLWDQRGVLQGVKSAEELPLNKIRTMTKSSFATGVTTFPEKKIAVGKTGGLFERIQGKALSDKAQLDTWLHEYNHPGVEHVTNTRMKEVLKRADEAGIRIPGSTFISKHWNPAKYGSDRNAAIAEEIFVDTMTKLSPGEINYLLGKIATKSQKSAFVPGIQSPALKPSIEPVYKSSQKLPPNSAFVTSEEGNIFRGNNHAEALMALEKAGDTYPSKRKFGWVVKGKLIYDSEANPKMILRMLQE